MLIHFIITFISAIALTLPLIHTPLHLGSITLLLAILSALLLSASFPSWFGYILVLIYIGGILIIFIYFIVITPNQYINTRPLKSTLFSLLILTILINSYSFLPFNIFSVSSFQKLIPAFFFPSQGPLLLIVITILFISLIIVVKISTPNKGPFRPFK